MKNNDYLIFGLRPIIEAIKQGKTIDKLFVQPNLNGDIYNELMTLVKEHQINPKRVPVEKLNRLTRENHQGAVAFIAPIAFHELEPLITKIKEEKKQPIVLILDRITDVRNFGAIARTAECTGVDAIIIPNEQTAPVSAEAVKTSTGALLKIPVCKVGHLRDAVFLLQQEEFKVIAASEKTNKTVYDLDLKQPLGLIMGSEEDGVSSNLLKVIDEAAKLPMKGEISSLNVSVACGAFLYEILRQRG